MKTVTRSRSLAVVTLAYVIAVAVAVGWLYPNYFGEFGFWVAMALFVIDRVSRFVPRPPERALR